MIESPLYCIDNTASSTAGLVPNFIYFLHVVPQYSTTRAAVASPVQFIPGGAFCVGWDAGGPYRL
jgi:hypothetical protein